MYYLFLCSPSHFFVCCVFHQDKMSTLLCCLTCCPWELHDEVADSQVRFTSLHSPLSHFLSFSALMKMPASYLYTRLIRITVLHRQGFDVAVCKLKHFGDSQLVFNYLSLLNTDSHYYLFVLFLFKGALLLSLHSAHSVLTSTVLLSPKFQIQSLQERRHWSELSKNPAQPQSCSIDDIQWRKP